MKKRILQIIALTVIVIIAATFVYRSGIQTTEGTYQVIGVNDKGIIIQLGGGKTQAVHTSGDMMQIIQLDHYYDLRFEKAPLQPPQLDYIRLNANKSQQS